MKKQIETRSYQATTLKGYAAAWRQLIQLNFYGHKKRRKSTLINWFSLVFFLS